jgi:hypothetical protein
VAQKQDHEIELYYPALNINGGKFMLVYNYDYDGCFIGVSEADESPLEPNVYLIPAYATTVEVPQFNEGFIPVWNGESWDIKDISLEIPKPEEPVESNPKTYAELLEEKIIRLENENATLKDTVDILGISLL